MLGFPFCLAGINGDRLRGGLAVGDLHYFPLVQTLTGTLASQKFVGKVEVVMRYLFSSVLE